MSASQQVIHSITIDKLKGIHQSGEIILDSKPLMAIMGPNGSGKSTILHALACAYKPPSGSKLENFKFSHFFLPTSDSTWNGSKFSIRHSYRLKQEQHENVVSHYAKPTDRWTPRYERRPERHVFYVGISTCVPKIEQEPIRSYLSLSKEHVDPACATWVVERASHVFGKEYAEYVRKKVPGRRNYIGSASGGIEYSALSMGAGEQRIFFILDMIFNTPKNSLILIDELDLLLHTDALIRLLDVLSSRAKEKNLQIIFTSHREAIIEATPNLSVTHIYQSSRKTLFFRDTKPDAIQRLTGKQIRSLDIWVEDDLAAAIISRAAAMLGLKRHVSIYKFGAASNGFVVAAGLIFKNEPGDVLIILDGDVFRTESQKIEQLKKVITGTESNADEKRSKALSLIAEFNLPPEQTPEIFFKSLVQSSTTKSTDAEEIKEIIGGITSPLDKHDLINKCIERLGVSREVGLEQLTALAAHSSEWMNYVMPAVRWMHEKRDSLLEDAKPLMSQITPAH